ncbi:Kelch repeat-containing protein [Ruminiclostridium papyrosolvens]|uniref:Galactose oxidase n=1 Tax=Ruminiclostridium papyrosolvens C7 TaxID=1330534 RepID=U4R6G1_9FIRM|nr:kelch repeat-containing protein [Ruminiclostridium papyrosolvens]EPR14091.1 galactose oxidase [Ruminiclostridium papyrosolvens C7]
MFLHKTGKKIMAFLLAMSIVLSGITIVGNPTVKKDFVKFGNEVKAVTGIYYYSQYTTKVVNGVITKNSLVKSDIQVPDGTYPDDGVYTDGYWYVKGNKATFEEKWTVMGSIRGHVYTNGVAIGNKIYIFGGKSYWSGYNKELLVYDLAANTWTTNSDNDPSGREEHTAVAINGKMYVFGGINYYSGSVVYNKDLWEYDPATAKWTKKKDAPDARSRHEAVVVNGKMYVIGGCNDGNNATSILVYDPITDTWEQKTGIPFARSFQSAAVINGKIYIYGGYDTTSHNDLWEYDPIANTWLKKKDNPIEVYGQPAAVVLNNKMYISGGYFANGIATNQLLEYDPKNDIWTQRKSCPIAHKRNSATEMNGKMYIYGGLDVENNFIDRVTEYSINYYPVFEAVTPKQNEVFSEADTNFVPQITVSDENNDPLTCKYYIDSETTPRDTKSVNNTTETKSVSFSPIDMSSLSDGTHTITYEVTDGRTTEPFTQTINFQVDKSAPLHGEISSSSTTDTVTLSGKATDSIAGLAMEPYRYTIGSEVSSWIDSGTYTSQSDLTPNTQYLTKFEAKDAKGHISASLQNVYTKATVPTLEVNNPASYALDIETTDNNSAATQYQVSVNNGSQYVTQEGTLTSAPAWITLKNKKVTVTGLYPERTYTFTARARNAENIETVASSSVSGTTLIAPPGSPANIIATATDKTITVSWDASSGAIGYEVEVDGTVVNTDTATVYTHVGLNPGTPHTYRVRGRNAGGPGNWSAPITKSTLPASPDIPVNLNTVPLSTSITVTWNNVSGATGYDIEVDGVLVNNGPNTNYIHNSLTPGTHHSYRVRSINPGGKSEWSGYVNTTTLLDTVPVPVNISATPALNSITLTWDKVSGASGYEISVDGAAFDNGTRTTYTHSNLAPGTQHVYRVRAKKSGITSEWSAAIVSATLTNEFGAPSNLKAISDNTSIVLSWNQVVNATGYEVEVDGAVTDNGDETSCIHNGLLPNTTHTYRVRAKSNTGVSEWTEPLTINAFLLQTPQGLTATSEETSLTINWQPIEGATTYELDFDGSIITGISETTYLAEGLEANSQHEIRVRAVSGGGTSNWSNPLIKSTKFTSGNVPNVAGIAKKTSISIMWNKIDGAISYDVEADGIITSSVNATTFTSKGLQTGTKHTYRVRANNSSGAGEWCSLFSVSTLPQGPAIPSNLVSSSNMTSILVSWDKVAGAEEFEIEVDGTIVDNGTGTSYLHKGLSPDTTHTYRVRARSISGSSEWSTPMIIKTLNSVQTYDITSLSGEEFDLILSGSDIQDLNRYTFSIQYDTNDFDLIDLCGFTPKTDTQEGDIYGTDITVKQVAPGTIVFVKNGSAQSWQVWSGIVNSIRLRAKHDGPAQITYTIQ